MSGGLLADVVDLLGLPERIEERLRVDDGLPARCLAFNRWGTLLAAGCGQGTVAVFDSQTRGVACRLEGGHGPDADVTALLWSADGGTLLSGAADGSLACWDVADGALRWRQQLVGEGAVTQLAWAGISGQGESVREQQQQQGQQLQQPGEGEVLASRGASPALLVSVQDRTQQQPVPVLPIGEAANGRQGGGGSNGSGGSGSSGTGGGAAGGGQVAVPSSDGRLIYAGCAGMLLVLRRADLALLDVLKIEGSPPFISLELAPNGKRLLVTTADTHLRVFLLHRPGARQPLRSDRWLAAAAAAAGGAGWGGLAGAGRQQQVEQLNGVQQQQQQQHAEDPSAWEAVDAEEAARLAGRPSRHPNSLFFDDSRAWLTQQLDFSLPRSRPRGRPWRCAAFSPDGEYFASACASGGLVAHLWEAEAEARCNAVLEGQGSSKEGIAAMCWHPSCTPMQLLTVSTAGWIDVWAKNFVENWSAFAPDFQELHVNDEYIEPEDEFDTNPRPADQAAAAAEAEKAAAALADEEAPIDIGTLGERDGAAAAMLAAACGGGAPLLHLPLRLEQRPQEDEEEEEQQQERSLPPKQQGGQEGGAAQAGEATGAGACREAPPEQANGTHGSDVEAPAAAVAAVSAHMEEEEAAGGAASAMEVSEQQGPPPAPMQQDGEQQPSEQQGEADGGAAPKRQRSG